MRTKNRLLLVLNSLFWPRHSPSCEYRVVAVSGLVYNWNALVLCSAEWESAERGNSDYAQDKSQCGLARREKGGREGARKRASRCPIISLSFPCAELILLLKCAGIWSSCCTCILQEEQEPSYYVIHQRRQQTDCDETRSRSLRTIGPLMFENEWNKNL